MIVHLLRKKKPDASFDPSRYVPVIRCSICTGEQVAGFRDRTTGKIEDVQLIRNERDLRRFREMYGLPDEPIEKVY